MENKKFSVKVIEEGRLNAYESGQIFGGKPICDGIHTVSECRTYTTCSRNEIGQIGYVDCPDGPDGSKTTCLSGYTNSSAMMSFSTAIMR